MNAQQTKKPIEILSEDENERLSQLLAIVIGPEFDENPSEKLQKTLELKSAEAAMLEEYLQPESHQVLLDLGSGLGVTANHLSQRVEKVICCDVYSEMLELAQSLNRERENIEYVPIPSYDLSKIEENSIDIVYSLGLFIHFNLYDTYLYFKEFQRIIKPSGQCFLNLKDANELDMDLFVQDVRRYNVNGYKTGGLQQ